MPVTPCPPGPGAALKALAPRRFRFTDISLTQATTDLEALSHVLRRSDDLHAHFHWDAGATAADSHIVLDSMMHRDKRPCALWSDANGMVEIVPVVALHWICLGLGIAGAALLGRPAPSAAPGESGGAHGGA